MVSPEAGYGAERFGVCPMCLGFALARCLLAILPWHPCLNVYSVLSCIASVSPVCTFLIGTHNEEIGTESFRRGFLTALELAKSVRTLGVD